MTHGELGGRAGGRGSSWDKGQVRRSVGRVCSCPQKCLSPLSMSVCFCFLFRLTTSAIRAPLTRFLGTWSVLHPLALNLCQIFASLFSLVICLIPETPQGWWWGFWNSGLSFLVLKVPDPVAGPQKALNM